MGIYGSPELKNNENVSYKHIMIFCSKCGTQYSKKLRKCPECGTKYTQPFYNRWWFWFIVAISLLIILADSSGSSRSKKELLAEFSNAPKEEVAISEDEYKASCSFIPYADINRNPNNYIGQNVVFNGKVVQVQESGINIVLRVNITKDNYGLWTDTMYVEYQRKTDTESRVLEGDMITMYGKMNGIKTYTSVLGNQVSIPYLLAEYVKVN